MRYHPRPTTVRVTFLAFVDEFLRPIGTVASVDDLDATLAQITLRLGFEYFALSHHVDINCGLPNAIRLHNYPVQWADYYDRRSLGVCDPVHRASQATGLGFSWSQLPRMIRLTAADRLMLDLGAAEGIGDGFTVPANIPGEAHGSCSFASHATRPVDRDNLPLAQLAGAFAFEGARRLWSVRTLDADPSPSLTDRQRDCVLWVARGKSDWEIGRILGVSQETVIRHLKHARERYGVQKRTLLAIRAIFDGTLSFDDVLKR